MQGQDTAVFQTVLADQRRRIVGRNPQPGPDTEEREAAARMAAIRVHSRLSHGFKVRLWRPARGRPAAEKRPYGWDWDGRQNGWLDHPYRLIVPRRDGSGVREYFVSEPYDLDDEGFDNLASIKADGWRVSIRSEWAVHFPGSTTAIILSRPAPDDP